MKLRAVLVRMQRPSSVVSISCVWSFQMITVQSVIMNPLSYLPVLPSQLICTSFEGGAHFLGSLLPPQTAEGPC